MPKKKKATAEYFTECTTGQRKTVPSAAYVEVCIARADLKHKTYNAQEEAAQLAKQKREWVVSHGALAEEYAKAGDEIERLRQDIADLEDPTSLRDRFAMAALVAMGAVVVAGEYEDTARAAYAIADGMIEGRKR